MLLKWVQQMLRVKEVYGQGLIMAILTLLMQGC